MGFAEKEEGGWVAGGCKCKCEDHTVRRVCVSRMRPAYSARTHTYGRERGRGGRGRRYHPRGVFVIVMRPPRYRIPRVRFSKITHGHPAHRRVCLRLRRSYSRVSQRTQLRTHRRVPLPRAPSPARVNARRSRGSLMSVLENRTDGGRKPSRVRGSIRSRPRDRRHARHAPD